MDGALLLDTCAVIWIANSDALSAQALVAIEGARANDEHVYVSPITSWEIGLLVSRGRMDLLMPPERWFGRFLQAPGVRLAGMTPEILIASSFLPGNPPRDPADRILAASAREYGYMLMTRDRPLLEYAEQGHIQAIAC